MLFPAEFERIFHESLTLKTKAIDKKTKQEHPLFIKFQEPTCFKDLLETPYYPSSITVESIINSKKIQMGELRFKDATDDFNENYFFISWIQNFEGSQYKHIGQALFEFSFRLSVLLGNEGNIKNESMTEAIHFHEKMGMKQEPEISGSKPTPMSLSESGKEYWLKYCELTTLSPPEALALRKKRQELILSKLPSSAPALQFTFTTTSFLENKKSTQDSLSEKKTFKHGG